MHNFLMFTALGAGSGLSPKAPGTFGTLAAVPIVVLTAGFPLVAKLFVFIAVFLLGVAASEYYEQYTGTKDPGAVVIDEIAGYLLTMLFFQVTVINLILAFVFFRIFDIAKPFPIKKAESVGGGVGIMIDDIVAAVYAVILMLIARYFIG